MELSDYLNALVSGTLTVPATSYIINWLSARIEGPLTKNAKRAIAFTVAALLVVAAFVLQIGLGYVEQPGDVARWIEQLVPLVGVAITASQIVLSGWKRGQPVADEPVRIQPVEPDPAGE